MNPLLDEHKKLLKIVARAEATKSRSDGFVGAGVYLRHGNIVKKMDLNGWPPVMNLAKTLVEHGLIEPIDGEDERTVRLTDSGRNYFSDKKTVLQAVSEAPLAKTGSHYYVNLSRIEELKSLKNFDFKKLIRTCEELNIVFRSECCLATAMLLRSILDHVPPVFGFQSFAEILNNYSSARSFKESISRLEESSRKIADAHLHTRIRLQETLPTSTQVDFSNDLDVLLGEIVRIGCVSV